MRINGLWPFVAITIAACRSDTQRPPQDDTRSSAKVIAKLGECGYVRPKSAPKHLAFMVESGRISRVEVQAGSDIGTAEGAKIGDAESRIRTLYPGVEVRPSFETDGKKVINYRSGTLPAVEYVEGCG